MKITLSALLLFILSANIMAQEATVNQVISQEIKDHIKARVEGGINQSIVVGLISGDDIDYFSFGTSEKDGFKVNENTVYEIGSISKTFTTTMLADEVVKGQMSLDDPITKYLPEGVNVPSRNNSEITLVDLATHSSGLPRMPSNFSPADPTNPYIDYTPELMYQFISAHELTRDIGDSFEYSNFGMGLMGHILELKNKMAYEELLSSRIALPLMMNSTGIELSEIMKKNLALGHDSGKVVSNWDITGLAGAGAIRSTTSDMVKYVKANMGISNTELSEAFKLAHKKTFVDSVQGTSIGLGWIFENDGEVIWHNGGTGGYRAFAGFSANGELGVVVLTNSTASVDALGFKLLGSPSELKMPKKPVNRYLYDYIEENGVEPAIKLYTKLKNENSEEYNLNESELNILGYRLMGQDKDQEALAIFQFNAEQYPKSSNVYDSLGEVQLKTGDTISAVFNYKTAVTMNPNNTGAIKLLKELGYDVSNLVKDIKVPDNILESYVGEYQLAPSFSIVVSTDSSKIYIQATAQPKFEIFATTENEFYLKVVEARIVFNKGENGKIDSLTLYQNGQEMPGKKIK